MSVRFYNAVDIPVLPEPPSPEPGFAKIYGRGESAYAIFPDGEEKLLSGGVVVVPGTDRDISFPDAVFVKEGLSTQFKVTDTGALSDSPNIGPIVLADSSAVSDAAAALIVTRQDDSLATSDQASSTIITRRGDSLASSETQDTTINLVDKGSASDVRQDAEIDSVSSANVVEANSAFSNPGNLVDVSDATASSLTATRTAFSNSVTTTGNIEVSLPDLSITPDPSVVSVELQWGWSTRVGGANIARSGNSVNIDIEYSTNNGSTFTLLENVTTPVDSSDGTTSITATYSQIQALRFRVSGSVTSGTNATLNASQVFNIFYTRASLSLIQST